MKLNNSMFSSIRLQVVGLNFSKFLEDCKKLNCALHNWVKIDARTNEFSLSVSDYKQLLKSRSFRSYGVRVKKQNGLYFFLKNIKAKIGLLVGVALVVVLFAVMSQFTFYINISGNETISRVEILEALSNHGVSVGKINNATNEEMETILKQNFDDISLVSVIKQGTNIVIALKEKEKIDTQVEALYADTNMFIINIIVSQGTAMVKKGDMVIKGSVLVEPYQKNAKGEKVECSPVATIVCDAWYVGQVEFETKEVKQVKTGKKVLTNNSFTLFNITFWQYTKAHQFENYVTETNTMQLFQNSFIPLILNQTVVYECKEKVVLHDFEKSKNLCISQSKALANQSFPTGETILKESVVISTIGTQMLIQTVLYTQMTLQTS